jgi:hypothetical protein
LVKKDIFRNLMWYTMADSNKQYPLTLETVKNIKAQNRQGIRPEELETAEVITGKPKEVEPEYADLVGQISLKSLEKTTRKRREKERGQQQRQQGGGQRPQSPQQGAGQQKQGQPQQRQGQPQRRNDQPGQGTNPNANQPQQGGQPRNQNKPQQGGQPRSQNRPQGGGNKRPPSK